MFSCRVLCHFCIHGRGNGIAIAWRGAWQGQICQENSLILFCCGCPSKPLKWMSLPWGVLQLPCGLQEKISSQCFPTVPPPPHRTSARHLARNLEGFLISFYVHTDCPHKRVRLYYTLCVVGGLHTAVQQTTCSLSTVWEWCCLKYPVIFCHQVIWEWNYINEQQRGQTGFTLLLQKSPHLPVTLALCWTMPWGKHSLLEQYFEYFISGEI